MIEAFRWGVFEAFLDPGIGSEQAGRRPVMVVSNDRFNNAMPSVTVLPLTSTMRTLYPSEVSLPAEAAGQPQASIAMAHQVRTISKTRLRRQIGTLTDPLLQRDIEAAIRSHFDLD